MFKNYTLREQKQNELQWWYEQRMKDDQRDKKWTKKIDESINKLENELLNDVRNDVTKHKSDKNK